MARSVERASLYRAPINLWVEDQLTRAYLDAVWNSPDVGFLIGGGNEGVLGIVNDAEKAGYPNVFAVIDRDFRQSNRSSWMDPAKTSRRFILSVHEIENHLLDPTALAACRFNNRGKTAAEIETMMTTAAGRLGWWAACRDVVAELRKRFREGFLNDPTCAVSCGDEARDHICQSPWFQKLAQETARTTEADIHRLLSDAHVRANQSLSDGRWKTEFAGKEILRDVGSRICDHTSFPRHSTTSTPFDEDLAKEVGAWQRANKAVPADLTDLLAALQQRISRARTKP
ncbi:MAG: hypothetical protein ACLQGP_08785 [Isosphaeraceae bacterium]